MKTKLQSLKEFAAKGEWQKALAIAAKFHDLGEHRKAITLASECFTNPRFYSQLVNIELSKTEGIAALVTRYNL